MIFGPKQAVIERQPSCRWSTVALSNPAHTIRAPEVVEE
jgi:hypothetical protein